MPNIVRKLRSLCAIRFDQVCERSSRIKLQFREANVFGPAILRDKTADPVLAVPGELDDYCAIELESIFRRRLQFAINNMPVPNKKFVALKPHPICHL